MPSIDDQTWREVCKIQDALVKLYNQFHEVDPTIRLNWSVMPAVGTLFLTFYALDGKTKIRLDDRADWEYAGERREETYNTMVKKIQEWKRRYGLLTEQH